MTHPSDLDLGIGTTLEVAKGETVSLEQDIWSAQVEGSFQGRRVIDTLTVLKGGESHSLGYTRKVNVRGLGSRAIVFGNVREVTVSGGGSSAILFGLPSSAAVLGGELTVVYAGREQLPKPQGKKVGFGGGSHNIRLVSREYQETPFGLVTQDTVPWAPLGPEIEEAMDRFESVLGPEGVTDYRALLGGSYIVQTLVSKETAGTY